MESGKCRGCCADIVWAVTGKGRPQPLDAKPERRIVADFAPGGLGAGPHLKAEQRVAVSYDAASGQHRATVVKTYALDSGVIGTAKEVYMPHHAVCPSASRFTGGR